MAQSQADKAQQRIEAKEIAQTVRLKRAHLKRELKLGKLSALRTLLNPPDWLLNMTALDFVMAIPRVGHDRAMRYLNEIEASELREIGKLTSRQRIALYDSLVTHWVFN